MLASAMGHIDIVNLLLAERGINANFVRGDNGK